MAHPSHNIRTSVCLTAGLGSTCLETTFPRKECDVSSISGVSTLAPFSGSGQSLLVLRWEIFLWAAGNWTREEIGKGSGAIRKLHSEYGSRRCGTKSLSLQTNCDAWPHRFHSLPCLGLHFPLSLAGLSYVGTPNSVPSFSANW